MISFKSVTERNNLVRMWGGVLLCMRSIDKMKLSYSWNFGRSM